MFIPSPWTSKHNLLPGDTVPCQRCALGQHACVQCHLGGLSSLDGEIHAQLHFNFHAVSRNVFRPGLAAIPRGSQECGRRSPVLHVSKCRFEFAAVGPPLPPLAPLWVSHSSRTNWTTCLGKRFFTNHAKCTHQTVRCVDAPQNPANAASPLTPLFFSFETGRSLVVVFIGRFGRRAARHTGHRQCFCIFQRVRFVRVSLNGSCPTPR